MITNKVYYDINDNTRHQCNCEICDRPTALFMPAMCDFEILTKLLDHSNPASQLKTERPKMIYSDLGVFILCSERCLKEWTERNIQMLEDECSNDIPEDNPDISDDIDDRDDA